MSTATPGGEDCPISIWMLRARQAGQEVYRKLLNESFKLRSGDRNGRQKGGSYDHNKDRADGNLNISRLIGYPLPHASSCINMIVDFQI